MVRNVEALIEGWFGNVSGVELPSALFRRHGDVFSLANDLEAESL